MSAIATTPHAVLDLNRALHDAGIDVNDHCEMAAFQDTTTTGEWAVLLCWFEEEEDVLLTPEQAGKLTEWLYLPTCPGKIMAKARELAHE